MFNRREGKVYGWEKNSGQLENLVGEGYGNFSHYLCFATEVLSAEG